MAAGQRAFAQKLNKQGAAEVRRQVSVAYMKESGPSKQDIPLSISRTSISSLLTPSSDCKALDYEDYVSMHQTVIETDPMRELLEFPGDDIDVNMLPKQCRTIAPIIPEHGYEQDAHVRDCIRCYTSDYTVVTRRYQVYSSSHAGGKDESVGRQSSLAPLVRQIFEVDMDDLHEKADQRHQRPLCSMSETPRSSWANSIYDLNTSESDYLLPNLLERTPAEDLDRENSESRQKDRHDTVFNLFPIQEDEELIERRMVAGLPAEHLGHRILVNCLQLKLELEIEPIFASMALYDAKEKKKISENFHFDLNADSLKRMLENHVPVMDTSTRSRSCLFSITYPSADIFLVIRLEKVLQQGDITECAEPYMKDDKNKDKVKANAAYFCERLGKYRMPFAWTAVNLINIITGTGSLERDASMERDTSASSSLDRRSSLIEKQLESFRRKKDELVGQRRNSLERCRSGGGERRSWPNEESGHVLDSFRPMTITVSNFFKQEADKLGDDDLYKFLADLKRPSSFLKKSKSIPGMMKLDISPCPDEPRCCLSPELYKIDPYPDDLARPTREVVEFPSREVYEPFTTYRNLLYVYPKLVNFASKQGSARNIAVKMQFLAGEDEHHALPFIFGKSSCPELTREAYASVTYHSKTPQFYEEIKLKLPGRLSEGHHLLFTFYHVSCQKKLEQTQVEQPVGYTWLPIMRDGRLMVGEYLLPVLQEKPPPSYSMLQPDTSFDLPGYKWLDGHKGLLSIVVEAVSSIHTQDEHLDRFLNLVHMAEESRVPPRIGPDNYEVDLKRSIHDIYQTQTEPLVKFMNLVLDKLIYLMVKAPVVSGQVINVGQACFEAMGQIIKRLSIELDERCDQHGRNLLLTQYIEYCCSLPHPESSKSPHQARSASGQVMSPTYQKVYSKKIVHEELALLWVTSNGSSRQLSLENAWFFFELMNKSIAVDLSRVGKLNSSRKNLFPTRFIEDITGLIGMITKDIVDRYLKDVVLIKNLNTALAFFLHDMLSLMDRGYVFQLIKDYCKVVAARVSTLADATTLTLLRLDFLRIICSHEHYVTLNLPMTNPSAPSSPCPSVSSGNSQHSYSSTSTLMMDKMAAFTDLTTEFRQHHFFVGLVLSDLSSALETLNPILHTRAINLVRNLLTNHDTDPRYTSPEVRARVSSLYLPLITIVIEALPQLYYPSSDRRRQETIFDDDDGQQSINEDVAQAISQTSVYTGPAMAGDFDSSAYDNHNKPRRTMLNPDATKNLLICFVWVLKNVDPQILYQWWSDIGIHKLSQLCDLLYLTVSNFEYRGKKTLTKQCSSQTMKKSSDMKSKLEEAILGLGSARSEMMLRRNKSQPSFYPHGTTPPSPNIETSRLRWRKDQTQWRQTCDVADRSSRVDDALDSHFEGNLSTEVTLICLDTLEHIIQIVQTSESLQTLLNSVLRILLHSLALNQSSQVLTHMFSVQRSLVSKFPELLFEEETEQCADLCLRLLKHCTSCIPSNRSHASASLYLLMRQNFEIGNNFARVKMQVTMALSRLVGKSQSFNEEYLRKSLKTILLYGQQDVELQETTFPEQVRDLIFNLHMILSDTVKMKEFLEDPEMLLDLMYRIAKGYQTSPDLRLTWLQNMAGKHSERNNHAEAAQCLIHAAGLVAEYLHMMEDRSYLPVGCVTLEKVTPNVLEESAISDDVVSPDGEGICAGKYFTESGFVGLVEQAASSFNMAGMYEAVNETHKLLIPIHEANKDYKRLATLHGKLEEALKNVLRSEGKRMFGTYFRVGFYGEKFGDLDGIEYIYKEPYITKLPEISHRLETFYSERFGPENLTMIKDSNQVEPEKMESGKAYIQITYVEPYFDMYEFRDRVTYFDKNYNIKRFMFATPFTLDGRAHGELHDQHKRKTILTTSNSFPYVKTRLQVVDREQIILTPIEVALEDVQKKTKELSMALQQEPPDPKILQMVLQGCIGTTVNQGPVEVAQVFLGGVAEGRLLPSQHHNRLRLSFKDFLKKCSDALQKNKAMIGHNQREYQRELERNYHSVKDRLSPLVSNHVTNGLYGKKNKHTHISNGNRRDSRGSYVSTDSRSSSGSRRRMGDVIMAP